MAFSYQSLLQLGLLLVFVLLVMSRGRTGRPTRGYLAALGCVAAASFAAHTELIRSHPNGYLQVHPTEFFHYYLGTKYFSELGYYDLYRAAVVAEHDLSPRDFRPDETITALRRPQFEIRKGDVLRSRDRIIRRFTPERWEEFKRDLAFLRSFNLRTWGSAPPERDHGYNGTPLTTAILGGLANHSGLPAAIFIPVAAWFDLVLILALSLLLWRLLGGEPALVFAALWALNPLNDYAFTGGSYLRHLYFAALALGVALLARRRSLAGGASLATATGLRLFPGLFPAAVVAHDLVNPEPLRRIRRNLPFYAGLVAVAGLLLLATAFVRAPDGRNGWLVFAERIAAHAANVSPNRIGLPYALSYSREHALTDSGARDSRRSAQEWRRGMRQSLADRAAIHWALVAIGALVSLAYLRSVSLERAPFVGLLWLFLLAMPSHYDYVVLGIVPIVFSDDRRTWLLFAALCGVLLLLKSSDALTRSLDGRYAAMSVAVGVFLAVVALLYTRDPRRLWPRAATALKSLAP